MEAKYRHLSEYGRDSREFLLRVRGVNPKWLDESAGIKVRAVKRFQEITWGSFLL